MGQLHACKISLVLAFCGLTVGSEMHGSVAWLQRIVDLLAEDLVPIGAPPALSLP